MPRNMLIDGKWTAGRGTAFPTYDPATGEVIAEVPEATAADVDEAVARAHRISVRYLHKILQPREVTLSAWIRRQRLERIRRDLANPLLADRTVSVIAARWGMLDGTHVSRALKAEYGRTAADIRKGSAEPGLNSP